MLTKESQLAALSQCITTYLTVGKYGLGSDVEDRVISSGEAWMKVNSSLRAKDTHGNVLT